MLITSYRRGTAGERDFAQAGDADNDNGVTAKEAAAFFGISLPTFWRRVGDGSISQPFYPAERTPRWVPSKLREDRERMQMSPAEARDRRRKAKLARTTAERTTTHP